MKKLMILGASYSQVPLIRAAKRLGLYTVVASIPGSYPGFGEADAVCYADITDPEAVLAAARAEQIDGICTCCMDTGLLAQGYVCSQLGLPGPSWETARLCTNKYRMKEAFLAAGVNTARFRKISGRDDLVPAMQDLRFPLIIKAVDQMGSRGIFICQNEEEVLSCYDRSLAASRKSYCILEEYLQGEMFDMEAMIQDGVPVYVLPSNSDHRKMNPPFSKGHSVPWLHLDAMGEKAAVQVRKAASALGIENAPMDLDVMLLDGEVYVIEASARAGATGIAEMVGIYYGTDYYEAIAALAVGEDVSPRFADPPRIPCLTHLLSSPVTGVVRAIGNTVTPSEDIIDLSFNIRPGAAVRRMTNGGDRIGQVILRGDSPEACQQTLKDVLAHLTLEIEAEDHAGIHCYPVL
ncbi:MAG: ATP-grasp domain-containing protein [Clostridiales bacterium]|nr:ATP-grasp domain-containing protein [Clostridiales bacterium]